MNAARRTGFNRFIICGMWGTSTLQISVVDESDGSIIETRFGRGVSKLSGASFNEVLFSLCRDWVTSFDIKDVVLGGMVGASIGWWQVSYLQCPISLTELSRHIETKSVSGLKIHIAPGLTCLNFFNEPDVMRGEEVEVLAWLKSPSVGGQDRSLVCIPGTHTKWVEVVGDKITKFQSSVVGECFDLLARNGVLVSEYEDGQLCSEAFLAGVDAIAKYPSALPQLLMSVRSRGLLAGQSNTQALDRLSGLLIGGDVVTSLKRTGFGAGNLAVPIIGTKNLTERYALAMRRVGITALPLDSLNMGVSGLFELSKNIRLTS